MEVTATSVNTGGGIMILLLIMGIILTIITIRRMITGQISLPRRAKILLSTVMIAWLLFMMLMMLPPTTVDNIFITEDTHIVTPVDPSETAKASQ